MYAADIDDLPSQITKVKKPEELNAAGRQKQFPKTAIAVAATAVVMMLLFGAAAVAAWIYFRRPAIVPANNSNITNINKDTFPPRNINSNSNATPTPTLTPASSPTATALSNDNKPVFVITPTPPPAVDKQQAARDVSQQIYAWSSLAEAGDLNGYMRKYAPTVDYYRRRGASVEFVRADKQRAFNMFNRMSITISAMDVRVDDTGEHATASFDKEWLFDGNHRSTGKVRQEMQFRKINGQWLITGERDVKVY